ncbi:MAG: cysteine desulfurase [Candidatus Eremiobacteraeota bacterium]|nr:cysteine desulfurase [Candidatus Eremiobacteraeota bacterium]
MNLIYLDYNGTTPVDPEVVEAMLPYLREHYGNPSTKSSLGQKARAGLERARQQVAALINARPEEIYFTSGATEANNWVVLGLGPTQMVTTTIEHPSVLKACDRLEAQGIGTVRRLPVDGYGCLQPEQLEGVQARLVSVMHSNNEVGTVQPIAELAARARAAGALFHSDAAQSLGKLEVDVQAWGVDFLTMAGHKLYAPKGIGALYVRSGVPIDPYILGAGQERGQRSGTENVALAVALGAACELAGQRWRQDGSRMAQLRDHLQLRLQAELGDRVVVNGPPQDRLPNTLSVNFLGTTGAALLQQCPQLAASTGPACHDGVVRLSHVLAGLGVDPEVGKGAVRLSLGRLTTLQETEIAASTLIAAYQRLN